jgi:integrase
VNQIFINNGGNNIMNSEMTIRNGSKTVSDATINRDLTTLSRLFQWGVEEGFLPTRPVIRLPLEPERRSPRPVITLTEEQQLLSVASDHLKAIITAALDTGMRRSEILLQRVEHLDLARKVVMVSKSKTLGGENREIPLTGRLGDILASLHHKGGVVFLYKGCSIRSIKTAWKTAVERAGIRPFRFHDLRHAFASRMVEAGVMQEVRMSLMGHSVGPRVHSTYVHVGLAQKREAIRLLEDWARKQNHKENINDAS